MIHKFNSKEDLAADIEMHCEIEHSPDFGGHSESRWELDHYTITVDMSDVIEEHNPIETYMLLFCSRPSRLWRGDDVIEVIATMVPSLCKIEDGKFLATYELTVV